MLVSRDQLIQSIRQVFPFNLATLEEIERLADGVDVLFFEADKVIYQEGATAKYLYLIIEGEVEILKEEKKQLKKLNLLKEGNLFGEDAVGLSKKRRFSAHARRDSILIRIEKSLIDVVFAENCKIRLAFDLLISSYDILIEKHPHSITDQETIYFIGRPHRIPFLLKSLSCLLLFFLLLGVGRYFLLEEMITTKFFISTTGGLTTLLLLVIVWLFIEWRNDYCIFTDKRVINEERVILMHDLRFEIPLSAIVNLNIRKNIFGRGFGFGDLFIHTFTGMSRLKNTPKVETVAELLDFLWKKDKLNSLREEREAFQQMVDHQTGLQEETLLSSWDEPQEGAAKQEGIWASYKNRLFGFEIHQNGRIIYHTHWIILVKKTIFPTLVIISVASTLLFLSVNQYPILNNRLFLVSVSGIMGICLLWWVYQFADWRHDQYIITAEQIIDVNRKPFGIEDLRTAPIKNIQSVRYKRTGLLGLLLNFGTVYIRVGDEELTFDHVHNPAGVQGALFGALEQYFSKQKIADLSEQQQRLANWMTTYLDSNKKSDPGQPN